MIKAKVRYNDAEQGFDFSGFSTDKKPTRTYEGQAIPQMSSFLELDTSKKFLYSEQDAKWYRDYSSSGGDTPEADIATDEEVQEVVDNIWKD